MCTRRDISYVVSAVSRHLSNPKWILRYLRSMSKACLCYESDKLVLVGYTYADTQQICL